jgi:hypothetical protein
MSDLRRRIGGKSSQAKNGSSLSSSPSCFLPLQMLTLSPAYRYVAELRSLVDLYANPLLHPLLGTSPNPSQTVPSPLLGSTSPYLSSPSPTASPNPGSSSPNPGFPASPNPSSNNNSSPDLLPIAARFARSTPSLASSLGAADGGRTIRFLPSGQDLSDLPEIINEDAPPPQPPRKTGNLLGRSSLPALPTGARDRNASVISLDTAYLPPPPDSQSQSNSFTTRLASFGFGRSSSSSPKPNSSSTSARHPHRPPPTGAKLHKSSTQAPAEVLKPPALPEALKQVLESVTEMLKGHEELSARLKERWGKDFPLVRCVFLTLSALILRHPFEQRAD